MSDRVFYCPECRQQFADSRLPPRGQLFDCPRCHLLFIPADKDFAGGVGLREHESTWADEGIGQSPKAPFSEPIRHRLRRIKPHDLLIVWVTGLAMLVIAWVLFVIAHSSRGVHEISPPLARPPAPVADAAGSPPSNAVPVADAPSAQKTMPTESIFHLEEKALLGDWESAEHPLEGVADGEVFAITFGAGSAATIQSRSALNVETMTGQWRLAGSTLTLRLGDAGRMRDIPMTIEMIDGDRIRLATTGHQPAEFRRKKN